jgi:ParB family transcriptional regulator, chromosome partitioning protein
MSITTNKIKKVEVTLSTEIAELLKQSVQMPVNVSDIAFSPLNYRKLFSEEALQLFAQELAQHGIISPVLLRPKGNNRYELVAGERRLRAATIAKFQTVPAQVADLTDEQVREIQLSENLQRENPHPMNEASAIGDMQRAGLSMEEISLRLGKSKQFVYTRLKLLNLIEAFQDMVFADVLNMQDALQVATLSQDLQNDFFNERCKDWQKKNFQFSNVRWYINSYRYDLKNAPFNTKDKTLVPEVGACSVCPSNSATLKTLFPDVAKESVCSNRECYTNKCTVRYMAALGSAITTYQPVALLYSHQLSEMDEKLIPLIPGAAELPQYNSFDISLIQQPQPPDKENYMYDNGNGKPKLDKAEFDEAMEEYHSEGEAYNLHLKSGHYKVAVLLDRKNFDPVYFSMDKPRQSISGGRTVTAKDVQAAIKSGTATPELLKAEIERIKDREKRAEELDKEKIQLTVHNLFNEFVSSPEKNKSLTGADLAGARLIIYQSLDYSARQTVSDILFNQKGKRKRSDDNSASLYERLSSLSKPEFSFLIRMAMAGKSDSKYPGQAAGYFLYQMAKSAGVAVTTVEHSQAEKATERKAKQAVKLKELEGRIKKAKSK